MEQKRQSLDELLASVPREVEPPAHLWRKIEAERPVAVATATPRSPSFTEPSDAKYTQTRATLEATFRERVAQLDPATRAQIEASLAVIQRAHEDIRKALASAPSNPVLEQLFESTWHDEIDLYDHVVRATQPNLRT
jgi:hypothetical protein